MDQIHIGTRKGLFTATRTGNGSCPWTVVDAAFVGVEVPIVAVDRRDRTVYAGLNHGHFGSKLHRSDDDGETWIECSAPHYPPFPDGREIDRCPMRGIEIPWSLKLIWELTPGHPDHANELWCGTIPGGLFRSGDRGQSWELVRSLWDMPARRRWAGGGFDYPGIHSIVINPNDANDIRVGVSCGGVWRSLNGGNTWACRGTGLRAAYMPPEQANDPEIQDVHRLAQCAASPNVMWAQHHNGIFMTTDNGDQWHEITDAGPSTFGFAVAAHPHDAKTAWFVPAVKDEERVPADGNVCVTRTTDGGASFMTLRRGLPQGFAYDLCFRHGLAVDDSGNRLVMGSTTGSLWVSEDGGESWLTLSNHLPPIYSVTFA